MNIGSVSGSVAMFRPPGQPPVGMQQAMQKGMQGTAKLLGMSTDDLQTQLKSGKTLNDLAGAAGVSHADLIASIEQGMKAAAPQGLQAPSGVDASQMAENIAGGNGPHGHRSGGDDGDGNDKLSSLASVLGTDAATLLQQLQTSSLSGLLGNSSPYAKTANLQTSGLQTDVRA